MNRFVLDTNPLPIPFFESESFGRAKSVWFWYAPGPGTSRTASPNRLALPPNPFFSPPLTITVWYREGMDDELLFDLGPERVVGRCFITVSAPPTMRPNSLLITITLSRAYAILANCADAQSRLSFCLQVHNVPNRREVSSDDFYPHYCRIRYVVAGWVLMGSPRTMEFMQLLSVLTLL
eukprot:Opistho-2@11354